LIPLMVKRVVGISLDELGISLINIRSTGFINVAQLFHDARIRRKCSILTDSDAPIMDTTIKSGDSDNLKKFKIKLANSKKIGDTRKIKLEALSKGNPWVEAFYADYTFEVDFVKNGNAWEAQQVVNEVYKSAEKQKEADSDFESTDVEIYGRRILIMAQQEGKGWLAIMLGKHITCYTVIPKYIMKAIIFAKPSFTVALISNIIQYRIKVDEDINNKEVNEALTNYSKGSSTLTSIISEISKISPDDPILVLLNLL